MRERGGPGGHDAVSALVALMAPGGRLARQCGFSYELRLHRARGYGALKAILEILADEEGLTLTEISQRLQRTPGSTKDYLSWLEDVDLVTSRAEALQLRRSAAARLGAAALPADGADRRRSRARNPSLRAAAPAAAAGAGARDGRGRRRSPARKNARTGASSRSTEIAESGNRKLRLQAIANADVRYSIADYPILNP